MANNDFILLNELSTLTQIPINLLNKLNNIAILSLAQHIKMSEHNNSIYNVDIGIGNIKYQFTDEGDGLEFSFEPSSNLIDKITDSSLPLTEAIELRLKEKIIAAYKDLM